MLQALSPQQGLYNTVSPSRSAEEQPKIAMADPSFKGFQKHELSIPDEKIQEELKCIKWRSAAELPISKVLFYKVQNRKRTVSPWSVQISIENYVTVLHSVAQMPLFQALYIAKEALVGL
jgi:hypothetical protein